MSYSWTEKREKKTYEVAGTVSISTEEYRDLIEEKEQLLRDGQREHDDWYKEYNRANDLEKQLKKLQEKWDMFQDFLEDHLTVKEDWENYSNKKRLEGLEDE